MEEARQAVSTQAESPVNTSLSFFPTLFLYGWRGTSEEKSRFDGRLPEVCCPFRIFEFHLVYMWETHGHFIADDPIVRGHFIRPASHCTPSKKEGSMGDETLLSFKVKGHVQGGVLSPN